MRDFLAVALGGMLGSVARHAVNLGLTRINVPFGLPWGTFIVNVAGCLAIGIFAAASKRYAWLDTQWDMAVRVGFLGGLTTFSSLGLDVLRLWQGGRFGSASLVILLNVALGLAAVFVGDWAFRWLSR